MTDDRHTGPSRLPYMRGRLPGGRASASTPCYVRPTMLRRLALSFVVLASACGGEVLVEEVSSQVDAPTVQPYPESECNQLTTWRDCCNAGCRNARVDGERYCISEAQDCDIHPGICPEGTACLLTSGPGNGGCDMGYSVETVGFCAPVDE